jgi:hypothetical protein
MKASKTSKQWMREHVNDPYVQRAQKEGYRSRAAYKLLEIDEHDHLIKPRASELGSGLTFQQFLLHSTSKRIRVRSNIPTFYVTLHRWQDH